MMSNDKLISPARFWGNLPIVIGTDSSDAGRAQLLYIRLCQTGMDRMNEIEGMVTSR